MSTVNTCPNVRYNDAEFTVRIEDIVAVDYESADDGFDLYTAEVTSKDPFVQRTLKTYSFKGTIPNEHEDINEKISCVNFAEMVHDKVQKLHGAYDRKKKLLVLVNPFSGTGGAPKIWKQVKNTTHQGHATTLAKDLDLGEFRGIISVSGDGLLAEIVNGILQRKDRLQACRKLTLGVIPGGSGNGLASAIDASDPFSAALKIIRGKSQPMDIFSMVQSKKRSFGFLSISWAILSIIDLKSEGYRWLGPLRFDVKGVVEVMACQSYSAKLRLKLDKNNKNNNNNIIKDKGKDKENEKEKDKETKNEKDKDKGKDMETKNEKDKDKGKDMEAKNEKDKDKGKDMETKNEKDKDKGKDKNKDKEMKQDNDKEKKQEKEMEKEKEKEKNKEKEKAKDNKDRDKGNEKEKGGKDKVQEKKVEKESESDSEEKQGKKSTSPRKPTKKSSENEGKTNDNDKPDTKSPRKKSPKKNTTNDSSEEVLDNRKKAPKTKTDDDIPKAQKNKEKRRSMQITKPEKENQKKQRTKSMDFEAVKKAQEKNKKGEREGEGEGGKNGKNKVKREKDSDEEEEEKSPKKNKKRVKKDEESEEDVIQEKKSQKKKSPKKSTKKEFDHNVPEDALDLQYIEDTDEDDWINLDGDFSWFLAINSPKITTASTPICPSTNLGDGFLDVLVAPPMTRVELTELLLGLDDGTLATHPKMQIHKVKAFVLEPDHTKSKKGKGAPIALDGEHTDDSAIKVEVHPSLLRLFS